MKSARLILTALVVVLCLPLAAWRAAADVDSGVELSNSTATSGEESGVRRIERSRTHSLRVFVGDEQGLGVLGMFTVKTPSDVDTVDAVLTHTLQYRTSANARGVLAASVEEVGTEDNRSFRPGSYRITSRTPTSTTVQWVLRDLPAAGRTYEVRESLTVRRLDRDGPEAVLTSRRASTVLELWTD